MARARKIAQKQVLRYSEQKQRKPARSTEKPAVIVSSLGHWYMGCSPRGKAERQWLGSGAPVIVSSSVDLSPPQPHAVLCFCQHSGHATAQNIFSPILLRVVCSFQTATTLFCSAVLIRKQLVFPIPKLVSSELVFIHGLSRSILYHCTVCISTIPGQN